MSSSDLWDVPLNDDDVSYRCQGELTCVIVGVTLTGVLVSYRRHSVVSYRCHSGGDRCHGGVLDDVVWNVDDCHHSGFTAVLVEL